MHTRKILPVGAVYRHPCSRTRPCLRARPSTTQSKPQSKPSTTNRDSMSEQGWCGRHGAEGRLTCREGAIDCTRIARHQNEKGGGFLSAPAFFAPGTGSAAMLPGPERGVLPGHACWAPPQDACQPGVGAPTTCRVGRKVGELGTKRKYYSDHLSGGPPSQGAEGNVLRCSVQGGYANDRSACCNHFAESTQMGL